MYKIIRGVEPKDLEAKVNKKIKRGWREAGGVSIDSHGFLYPAVVKKKLKYKILEAGSLEALVKKLNKKPRWAAVGSMTVESCDGGYIYYQLIVKET